MMQYVRFSNNRRNHQLCTIVHCLVCIIVGWWCWLMCCFRVRLMRLWGMLMWRYWGCIIRLGRLGLGIGMGWLLRASLSIFRSIIIWMPFLVSLGKMAVMVKNGCRYISRGLLAEIRYRLGLGMESVRLGLSVLFLLSVFDDT